MRFNNFGVIGEIENLPGCSQFAVFHSVFVPPEERGKGLGTKAHEERLEEARKLGYQVAVCTALETNSAQIAILQNYGWEKVKRFLSNKTGNHVGLWIKTL